MKKLVTIISLISISAAAQASPKTVALLLTLTSPANNGTITVGTSFTESVVIKVLGPDAIDATDSLVFIDPAGAAQSTAFLYLGYAKNVGDTIQINRSGYTLGSGTNGTGSYCVGAFMQNGALIVMDSTYGVCNTVTIAGGTNTGVAQMQISGSNENGKLSFSPNPASSEINIDYKATGNAAVVASVFDITGRVVYTYNYGNSRSNFKLDVSNLKPGLYIVEMTQGTNRSIGKLNKL